MKELLIMEKQEVYNKYVGYISANKSLCQKQLSQLVKEFINADIYGKRTILLQYLIGASNYENKYIAYLLYDLLSGDSNGTIDTAEQIMILDSFPHPYLIGA